MPSIKTIDVASPIRLGTVERFPHYALPLNAEPLTSHIDDSQLSAGFRKELPAREDFSGEGCLLTQLGSLPHPTPIEANLGSPIQSFVAGCSLGCH
jgi:hypothetical protein